MQLAEIVNVLSLQAVAGTPKSGREVTGGIVSDLLSNVMGRGKSGNLWVTMQGHQNIVAVAALLDLAAIIVAGGAQVEKAASDKAEQEGIPVFTTNSSPFEVVGQLYRLGVK